MTKVGIKSGVNIFEVLQRAADVVHRTGEETVRGVLREEVKTVTESIRGKEKVNSVTKRKVIPQSNILEEIKNREDAISRKIGEKQLEVLKKELR